MYSNRISEFSRLIQIAITMNLDELVRDLSVLRAYELINENLEINYTDDPERMEQVVRTLTVADLVFHCLQGTFRVNHCPEDRKESLEWFIKFFAYLESESSNWELSEDDIVFPPGEDAMQVFNNKRITYILDISQLRFLYNQVNVIFNYFEELPVVKSEN